MRGAVPQVTCVFDLDAGFLMMTITFDPAEKLSLVFPQHRGSIIASIDPALFIARFLQNLVQQRLSSKSVMIIETVFI